MTSVSADDVPTSVYLYFDDSEVLIYVGVTSRGTKRQREHNSGKTWWGYVARQEVRHFPSRVDALAEERHLIRKHLPPFNTVHNPWSERIRGTYLEIRAALETTLTKQERASIRGGLRLTPTATPFPGHQFTLYSNPADAAALPGRLITRNIKNVRVGTPGRSNSGRVVTAKFLAGSLVVGITGKYLPEEVFNARARVAVLNNEKPSGFEIRRLLLNEDNPSSTPRRIDTWFAPGCEPGAGA